MDTDLMTYLKELGLLVDGSPAPAPVPKSPIDLIREFCASQPITPDVRPHQTGNHFYGPFSGKGAQTEAAKLSNLVVQTNPGDISGKCYSYINVEQRNMHVATLIDLGENVNERVIGPDQDIKGYKNCTPNLFCDSTGKKMPTLFRFFLDLDDTLGLTTEEEFLSIYRAIMFTHHIQQYEVRAKLQIYGYDKPGGKKSRHVLTNFFCRTGLEAKYFCKKIMKNIPERLHRIVDCNLYNNSSFGLRLPGCMKKPEDKASILGDIYKCGLPKFASLIVGDYDEIQQFDPQYLWEDEYVAKNLNQKLILDIQHKPSTHVPTSDKALREMFDYVREHFPCYDEPSPNSNMSKPHLLYNFPRLHSAHCPLCDRVHDSMGAYLITSNGNLFLKCARAEPSKSLHKIITNYTPRSKVVATADVKPQIMDISTCDIYEEKPTLVSSGPELFESNAQDLQDNVYDDQEAADEYGDDDPDNEACDLDDFMEDEVEDAKDLAHVAALEDAKKYIALSQDLKIVYKEIKNSSNVVIRSEYDHITRYCSELELNLAGAIQIFEKYFTMKVKKTGQIIKLNRWQRIPETLGKPMGLRCTYDDSGRFTGLMRHLTDFDIGLIATAVIVDEHFYKLGNETISRWTELNPPKLYDPDSFDQLMPADDVTQIDSKYISDAVQFSPEQDYYISSPWNTGKTFIFQEFLKGLAPEVKVLFVTPRKTLTSQMSNKLGIAAYTSIVGELNTASTPKSIFQLESLKRVLSDEVFDFLIIDEIDALSGHCFQSNNNIQSRAAMSTLRELIKNARSVIVSDNDLTSRFVQAVKSIRPTDVKANIYKNNYKSFAETSYSIINKNKDKKKPSQQIVEEIFKFCTINYEKMQDNQPFESCIVPCHSREMADSIYSQAVVNYGSAKCVLYTSKTSDLQKHKDFKDATAAWSDKLIIIYSPTVSIGISAEIKHLTTAFGIFNSETCSATQSAQMLFRARFVKTILIAHDKPVASDFYPEKPEFLYNWITNPGNRKFIPDEFRNDRCCGIDAKTSKCSDALDKFVSSHFESQMWLQSIIGIHRSRNNFARHLARILESAGCKAAHPIFYEARKETPQSGERAPLTNAEMMSVNISLEETLKTRHLSDVFIPDKELEIASKFSQDDLRENFQPAEVKASISARYLRDSFKVTNDDMTPAFIEYYEPLANKVRSLGEVMRMSVAKTNEYKYENKLDDNQVKVPLTMLEKEATNYIYRVGLALGVKFQHLDVLSPIKVSRETIEDCYEKYGLGINNDSLRVFNDRRGKFRMSSNGNILSKIATLNLVLKTIAAKIVNVDLGRKAKQNYEIQFEYKSSNPLIKTPNFNAVLERYLCITDTSILKTKKEEPTSSQSIPDNKELNDLLATLFQN